MGPILSDVLGQGTFLEDMKERVAQMNTDRIYIPTVSTNMTDTGVEFRSASHFGFAGSVFIAG